MSSTTVDRHAGHEGKAFAPAYIAAPTWWRKLLLATVAAIASIELIAWAFDLPWFGSESLLGPSQPTTAVAFLVLTGALHAANTGWTKLAASLGWSVAAIAACSLLLEISGIRFGANTPAFGIEIPGVAAIIAIACAGAAVGWIARQSRGWVGGLLAFLAALIAAEQLLMLAVAVDRSLPIDSVFGTIAPPTLICLALLAVELLARSPLDILAPLHRATFGVRAWLLALALAAALPVLLFAGVVSYRLAISERHSTLVELEQSAEFVASMVERYLRTVEDLADTLARTATHLTDEPAKLYDLAKSMADRSGGSRAVTLIEPGGQIVFDTRRPFGTELPKANDRQLAEIAAGATPHISDLYSAAVPETLVFRAGAPVVRDGRVVSLMVVSVDPKDLAAALSDEKLPHAGLAAVLDRRGSIVARTKDFERFVGKIATSSLLEARATADRGGFDGVAIDGVPVLGYFINLRNLGWTIAIGAPLSEFDALFEDLWRRLLGLWLVALLSAGACAFVVARHLNQKIADVAHAALSVGLGRTPTLDPTNVRELDDLAGSLASGHALIEARETALRAARDSFRHLVENSPFGIYAVDADFRLALVGNGAQAVFQNVRPLIGRDFAEVMRVLWPEPFATEVIDRFRHTLETGETYRSPSTVENRKDIDGVESYDWKIERTVLPDGRFGVVCHFYDLSERQRHAASLHASEERLRFSLEAADAGVWESNPDTGCFIASDRALALFGLPPDAAITQERALQAVHPNDRSAVRTGLETAMAEGVPFVAEMRVLLADGGIRWLESKATLNSDRSRLFGLVQDITERKRSEERIRLAQEAGGIGLFERDFVANVTRWSPEMFRLYGYDPAGRGAELDIDIAFQHLHPEDRDAHDAKRQDFQRSHETHFDFEFRIVRHDGAVRWILSRGEMTRDAQECPLIAAGVNVDITERKEREEHTALLMKEVNHRSKNLLAVVQAIARHTARGDNEKQFIERFADRLEGLSESQNLLVSSQWRGVDVGALVRSQLTHFADLVDDRIIVEGPTMQITPAAAQAIGMAIHELATNAGKYGALSVQTGRVRIDWASTSAAEATQFEMKWSEHDGPPCLPPQRRGFGHTVLVGMVKQALDAEVSLSYLHSGLVWQLSAPESRVCEKAFVSISN